MDESTYHRRADAFLQHLMERLEERDAQGELDCELQAGVLTVLLPSRRSFVVSKHAPMRQVWLSSPLSGGLHFSWDEPAQQWRLSDGRELEAVLMGDMGKL
jgi:iron donor protein CyaY